MAIIKSLFFFLVFALVVSTNALGQVTPWDVNDPKVIAVAKFAVDGHNKNSKPTLSFDSVYQAASKETDTNRTFILIIVAHDDAGKSGYYAVVVSVGNGVQELVSFKKTTPRGQGQAA